MKEKYINELKDFLLSKKNGSLPSSRCNEKYFLKHNKKHLLDFFNDTYPDSWTLTDKINATIKLEIFEIPKCEICGENYRRMVRLDGGGVGLSGECSVECSRKAASVRLRNISLNRDEEKAKEVRRKTMLKKYGVEYNSQRKEIKKILCRSPLKEEVYNKLMDYNWMYEEYVVKKRTSVEMAKYLGIYYGTVIDYLRKHNIEISGYINVSACEREVEEYLTDLGMSFKSNSKNIIHPFELDIYLPNYNFAIEIDGLYWHSYGIKEDSKDINRHLNKTLMCLKKNINVLHITDWQWNNQNEIVKSLITSRLNLQQKIGARECVIKKVSSKDSKIFLDNNHLQGNIDAKINIGLYFNDELVSLLVMGVPRNMSLKKNYEYEVFRFCNKNVFSVIGGFGKLLKYFKNEYKPKSILTYADRMIGEGKLYLQTGFKFLYSTNPGYFWTDGSDIIISRYKARKNNIHKLNLKNYDEKLGERENMMSNGFRRFWDCGSNVYGWKKE